MASVEETVQALNELSGKNESKSFLSLMFRDTEVLNVDLKNGVFNIEHEALIPYGLSLIDGADFETRLHNISTFREWCAERTLSMTKSHAKRICNALHIQQDDSIETKYNLALSYRCVSLDDSYWVRTNHDGRWADVNLFSNRSTNLLTPVSLLGKPSTLMRKLKNSSDLGVDGTFAKSWVREGDTLFLLKAADDTELRAELCASKVLDCFDVAHATYMEATYDDVKVTKSPIFTSDEWNLIKFKDIKTFYRLQGTALLDAMIRDKLLERQDIDKLYIYNYLLGNEDLHDGNWGILRKDSHITKLAPLYDFNYCFCNSYTTNLKLPCVPEIEVDEDGDVIYSRSLEDAAIEAAQRVKVVQTKKLTESLFPNHACWEEFKRRCSVIGVSLL